MKENCENSVKIAVRERILENNNDSIIRKIDRTGSFLVGEKVFCFDYILDNITQNELWDTLGKPLVDKIFLGFNATCLAYGQTGTGKTYSMGLNINEFINNKNSENMGIIPRCLDEIFNRITTHCQHSIAYMSFIEIYNEKVYDMLSNNCSEQINVKGYRYARDVKKQVNTIDEAYALLKKGNQNRHVRPTKMNSLSSRSHAIFTIHIMMESNTSVLNLVDLAGSEGVKRTGHEGLAREEGVNINQGLLSVGKVLQAIISKNKVVPYRDSALTWVLQDSLNVNSYFTLLACVSPLKEDLTETYSTLRFAQNAKLLKNDPQLNLQINNEVNKLKSKKSNSPLKNHRDRITALLPPFITSSQKKNMPKFNTFCTPNKVKQKFKKLNFTESEVAVQLTKVPRIHFENEKFDHLIQTNNDTLESRPSLNLSTSTALDVPISQSYSPIVKKCMSEFEPKLDKIEKLIESLKQNNEVTANTMTINTNSFENSGNYRTPKNKTDGLQWESIRKELKDIVREELRYVTNRNIIEEYNDNENCESNLPTEDRCFKIPFAPPVFQQSNDTEINIRKKKPHEPTKCILRSERSFSTDICLSQASLPTLRRSRRLSSISSTVNIIDTSPKNLRRSKRLSSISNIVNIIETSPKDLRRSKRLSSISNIVNIIETSPKNVRRSKRLSSISNIVNIIESSPKSVASSMMLEKRRSSVIERSVKNERKLRQHNLKNNYTKVSFINNYFIENQCETKKFKNLKSRHKEAVLKLINTGSIKELQILPQIGLKTAYQIVTHRTLNGIFKKLEHLQNLPVWKGKTWERFKQANNLE